MYKSHEALPCFINSVNNIKNKLVRNYKKLGILETNKVLLKQAGTPPTIRPRVIELGCSKSRRLFKRTHRYILAGASQVSDNVNSATCRKYRQRLSATSRNY